MRAIKGFIVVALSITISTFALGQHNKTNNNDTNQQYAQHMMRGQNQQQSQPGAMQGGGMMPGGMMGGMMSGQMGGMSGYMMGMHTLSVNTILMQSNRLDLSADQVKSLQQQALNLRKDMIDLRSELQKKQVQYQEYLLSDNLKQQQVLQYIEQSEQLQTNIQKRLAKSFFSAKDVLTEQQMENLVVMLSGMPHMNQQPGQNNMGMYEMHRLPGTEGMMQNN